jgi:hypothetical protein
VEKDRTGEGCAVVGGADGFTLGGAAAAEPVPALLAEACARVGRGLGRVVGSHHRVSTAYRVH